MSLLRPASPNGFRMREKSQLVPLGAMVGNAGNAGFGSDPTVTGQNQYFCVPTGQWVIRKRGGGGVPAALASIVRSSVLSPATPAAPAPRPRKNERRAIRYLLTAHLLRSERQVSATPRSRGPARRTSPPRRP